MLLFWNICNFSNFWSKISILWKTVRFVEMVDIVLNEMFPAWLKRMSGNGSNGSSNWIKKIIQIMLTNTKTETRQILKLSEIVTQNGCCWLLVQSLKWAARFGTNRMIKTLFNILDGNGEFSDVVKVWLSFYISKPPSANKKWNILLYKILDTFSDFKTLKHNPKITPNNPKQKQKKYSILVENHKILGPKSNCWSKIEILIENKKKTTKLFFQPPSIISFKTLGI